MKYVLLILTFFIVSGVAFSTPAFADHPKTDISVVPGSSVPGCDKTLECYDPSFMTIEVGSEVIWSNDDSAAHTVTSGTATDGPDGKFDSGLFLAGTTYSFMFESVGEYPYFCIVHPWMTGTITALQSSQNEEPEE